MSGTYPPLYKDMCTLYVEHREEYIPAPNWTHDCHRHVWMLRARRIRELQVSALLLTKLLTHKCRLHDALLTRLSNDDDMEKSLSTFANEMASCAMILGADVWSVTFAAL